MAMANTKRQTDIGLTMSSNDKHRNTDRSCSSNEQCDTIENFETLASVYMLTFIAFIPVH